MSEALGEVEINRVRWDDDSASVELVDGAVLHIAVREYEYPYAPEVKLQNVLEAGEMVDEYATALGWIAANEAELLSRWDTHVRGEK